MISFADARVRVKAQWPDYRTLPGGYETERDWLVLLDPLTIGGRIAAVDKSTGQIDWINETSPRYTQERPVGGNR